MTDTTNAANSPPITAECAANSQYRKKPVVIEAFRLGHENMPDWFCEARTSNSVTTHNADGRFRGGPDYALINTLEGQMRAEYGDYIIRGVKGELYPCKPDIFAQTYEPAAAAPQPQGGALTAEQRTVILDAMRSLSLRADELKEYNTSIDGTWCDAEEKAQYDAEVQLIERLRILAQAAPSAPQQAGDGLTDAKEALQYVVDCWEAAEVEGLADAISDAKNVRSPAAERLADLLERRISFGIERARAILAAPRQPGEMGAGVEADIPEAIRLLGLMFDGYENGISCNEDGDGAYLGQAFRLSEEDFGAIADLLNRRNPPRFDVRANGLVVAASAQQDEREAFEAWLQPYWSRETYTDPDGDRLYRENWVQGAWIAWQARTGSQQ